MMRIATKLAAAGVALLVLASARDAAAGPIITIAFPSPTRVSPNHDFVQRDLGRNSNGISFDDCEKDVSLEFVLAFGNLPTADVLQAWAGPEDCTQTAARSPTSGTCQPVSLVRPIQLTTMTVAIRGRDLAAIQGQASPAGTGGAAGGFETATNDAACFAQPRSAGVALSIAFIAFAPGTSDADAAFVYRPTSSAGEITVDTVGPAAPTAGSATHAATGARLTWTPSGDVDAFGFRVFCAPTPGTCPSDALAGHLDGRSIDAHYACAELNDRTSTEAAISGLAAGAPYTFAVSEVDLSGNVGAAALEGCAVTGAAAAGDGGTDVPSTVTAGCFCASHAASPRGSTYAASLAILTLALAFLRRR